MRDDDRWRRTTGVASRVLDDRVLVQRVDGAIGRRGDDTSDSADLIGGAALVWAAADSPATVDEISHRLYESLHAQPPPTRSRIVEAVTLLRDAGWLTNESAPSAQVPAAP
jgi:hypothetical protein